MTLSISEAYSLKANPPRVAFVRFPFGHATGEKGRADQQRRVVLEALKLLVEAEAPELRKLSHLKWRRTDYAALEPVTIGDVEMRSASRGPPATAAPGAANPRDPVSRAQRYPASSARPQVRALKNHRDAIPR